MRSKTLKLSIVIPTLNEASGLRRTLLHTYRVCSHPERLEVLVIDNGSADNTLATIADLGVKTFEQPDLKGKKHAVLNYGAEQAQGEVVVFLDADTLLPQDFDLHIDRCLAAPEVVGGAFDFAFVEKQWYLQGLAFANRIRIRIDHNFLGDQAVFCRKSTLATIGGYPAKAIMESSFLCKALKQKGRLKLVPARVHTSARRFLENGFIRVFLFDLKVWVLYSLGKNVDRFGASYWQHNDQSQSDG